MLPPEWRDVWQQGEIGALAFVIKFADDASEIELPLLSGPSTMTV